MNGFVYIIESPSKHDLLHGRVEGRALSEAFNLARIPFWYSLASDREMLAEALSSHLVDACSHQHPLVPILHFSLHGDENNVGLTSGESLSWHDLRYLLLPLNRMIQGGLIICMSSCFGYYGCRMAMYNDKEPPFYALVGNTHSTTWADSAVAYITFYHLLFKGLPVESCVESMKIASGDNNFGFEFGQSMKIAWLQYIQQIDASGFRQSIQQAASETRIMFLGDFSR
ncbi:hypothetical protein [Nostoc sp.]|uniref:hypothetical protein n=1 Tax=Nostoc sp. TaxID=1180 RepID=UPI00359394D1